MLASSAGLAAQIPPAALSISEFCTAHRISRAFFYLLQKDGSGPRLMRVRGRTLVTAEAAAEWRRKMEAASAGAA
jgi:hypothetical protein